MERQWKTSEKIIVIIAIFVIGFVVVRVTYAYFSIDIIGNDDATQTRVTTGLLNIKFDAAEYFNNPEMMLIDDANRATEADKISFSVSHMNDSTIAAKYLIYINNITITDNFKSPYFKWELLEGGSVVQSGNFTTIINDEILLTPLQINLPLGTTHTYELRAWLSNADIDQTSLLEGSFRGKVTVVAVAQ